MSERGQRRRRLREQRRLREALLLDLGALVYELHRQGRRAPELLQQKAAELTVVDEEVRELEAELDGRAHVASPGASDETAEVDAVADPELGEEDEPEEDEPEEGEPGEPPVEYEEEHQDAEGEGEDDLAEHADALAEHEEPRA